MGHTTQAGVDLLGFGPSAISELAGSYAQSHRDLPDWEQAVAEHGVATMRGHVLSPDDRERRWIIGRLICLGEVRAEEFEATFDGRFAERYAEVAEVPLLVLADVAALQAAVVEQLARDSELAARVGAVQLRVTVSCSFCHDGLHRDEAVFCSGCLAPAGLGGHRHRSSPAQRLESRHCRSRCRRTRAAG